MAAPEKLLKDTTHSIIVYRQHTGLRTFPGEGSVSPCRWQGLPPIELLLGEQRLCSSYSPVRGVIVDVYVAI